VMSAEFEFERGLIKLNFRTAQVEATVHKQKGYKHFTRCLPFERNTQYLELTRAVLEYYHSKLPLKADGRLVSLKEARTILKCGFTSVTNNFSF